MSLSEINKILDKIDINLGETDNKKLAGVLPILFQLIEQSNQDNEKLKISNVRLGFCLCYYFLIFDNIVPTWIRRSSISATE